MKLIFLGDLHGNLPATLAMEEQINNIHPDKIIFLGDAVGKGPSNAETCDWVRTHCQMCIGGNWDYGIGCRQFPDDAYFWRQLGDERMQWLGSLPMEGEVTLSGIRFRLFHGRPVEPLMMVQEKSEVLESTFQTQQGIFGGIIFADSHRPFLRTLNTGYMLNTGSVGNSMGVPKAHALLLEGEEGDAPAPLMMTILSVPYDNAAAVAMADEDLPHRDAYIKEITTGVYARKEQD